METVGVYSDADENALHVESVDVAIRIGGESPAESYLRADAIIEAAKISGADAVHPGYGFLAENAAFAEQVVDAGMIWVGPPPEVIRLLGDKIRAKEAAAAVGVPTGGVVEATPGTTPSGLTLPVIVKAVAGGGGRGMRIVRNHADITAAIEEASREAESAFGDGTVFIEPYIEHGRHIEVQILADSHGNVVHLGERDCSIQRRHQKVIEESPAPSLRNSVRKELHSRAVAFAQQVGYVSAGTVEFMVAKDGSISFLEVNTRLQVEHPVTEEVCGIDLVEAQLRIAEGDSLPFSQDEVDIDGHAIEARIVAENPATGWLPATGRIAAFDVGPRIRVDVGVQEGSDISPHYDSLIAKVIARGPTRHQAAMVLERALRAAHIAGVDTNQDTVVAILGESDFLAGRIDTDYLDEHPAVLSPQLEEVDETPLLVAAAFAVEHERQKMSVTGFAPSGWRNLRTQGQRQHWVEGDRELPLEYRFDPDGSAEVKRGPWPKADEDGALTDDDRPTSRVQVLKHTTDAPHQHSLALEVDGRRVLVRAIVADGMVYTSSPAGSMSLALVPRFIVPEYGDVGSGPNSPLPGTVLSIEVEPGDEVVEGQVLVVVEAMKMEHQITSAGPAVVESVPVEVGERVAAGDLLVELAPLDSSDG